jgi:hypothetical protein
MNCMKCGAETPDTQVFCDHCLSVMEDYPIKPGTHFHLPKRALAEDEQKKPAKKKRAPSPEEQISALRMKVLRLRLVAVILTFVLCVVSAFLVLKLYQDFSTPETGRNYTIDTSMD